MFPITFKKERALYLLDCLANDRPLLHDPDEPGWRVDEILQLAGVCFLAVAAHGPMRQATAERLQNREHKHPEHTEAEVETLMNDLFAVTQYIAQLTQFAYDGDYDERHEAVIRCGVQAVNTNVQASVVPVEGFKRMAGGSSSD
jgi:hypothetical protein